MTATTLLIIIGFFIALIIIAIHLYDRYLVGEIKAYENRLEKKGIFKRHYISKKSKK